MEILNAQIRNRKGNIGMNVTDTISFESAYNDHAGKILNLAYRMTGDEAAARDLTQDVFLRVYKGLADFDGRSELYTWIHRIALNHIMNYVNRERRYTWLKLMESDTGDDFGTQEAADEMDWQPLRSSTPDAELERKEKERIVLMCIQKLPVKYRVPLVLNRYDDLDYQSIADQLKISYSAVEYRIFRAKKMLAKTLKPWIRELIDKH